MEAAEKNRERCSLGSFRQFGTGVRAGFARFFAKNQAGRGCF